MVLFQNMNGFHDTYPEDYNGSSQDVIWVWSSALPVMYAEGMNTHKY